MKSLPTLIRLAQRRIDDVAVEINRLQAALGEQRQRRETATAKLEMEAGALGDGSDIQARSMFLAYTDKNKALVEDIERETAEIEAAIEGVRERLMEAYREKARLETLEKAHRTRALKERSRKEQAILDEVALLRRN